jgi:hypothetical protein
MAQSKAGADRLKAQRRIAAEIAKIGYALPGTLTVRAYRCGKANCACHGDPDALHGPYNYWTRKVGSRTKTRVLTDEQLEDYRQWLDNARRLKELVAELHELSVGIVDADTRGLRADRKRAATKGSAPQRSSQGASR